MKCELCGKVINDNEEAFEVDGIWLCSGCYATKAVDCEVCGDTHLRSDCHFRDGHWLCEDHKDFVVCEHCGKLVPEDEVHETSEGWMVCTDCKNEHYVNCDGCGYLILMDDAHNSHGRYYCDSCYKDSYRVMDYHDFNSRKYKPRRINDNDADERMLFGVELECDYGKLKIYNYDRWLDDDNLIHFESDGSLSDDGVECITMPCSLRFHQECMRWRNLCYLLKDDGFSSHDTSCCGLHVHMSRSELTPIQIIKMDVFLNRGYDFWSNIGRRSGIYGGHYDVQKKADKYKGEYDNWCSHNDRYQPLNTTNENTVEVRIFRGSLNPETILGTIELLHALPSFLDTIPITKVYDTVNNTKKYIRYVYERHDKYENSCRMMRRLVNDEKDVKLIGELDGKYIRCEDQNEI